MSGKIQSDAVSFDTSSQPVAANASNNQERSNSGTDMASEAPPGSIVISGSRNIHVGSNVNVGIKSRAIKRPPAHIPPAVSAMFRCSREVTDQQMLTTSRYLGAAWRDVARRLGFLGGETEEFEYRVDSLREACFRMLTAWRERESSAASLEALVKALWDEQAYDVLFKLVELETPH